MTLPAHICEWCGRLDDESFGMRCPCNAPRPVCRCLRCAPELHPDCTVRRCNHLRHARAARRRSRGAQLPTPQLAVVGIPGRPGGRARGVGRGAPPAAPTAGPSPSTVHPLPATSERHQSDEPQRRDHARA